MENRDLLESIGQQDLARVEALLAAGVPVDGSRWRRLCAPEEPTPLQAAVRTGAREIVARLLDHGADPNLETRKWMAPLALACQQGDLSIVELLVNRGARVNPMHRTRHPTPIETAAWYGHENVVAFLLERGANPDSVFARDIGSLVRISRPILAQLISAGGHAPPEVEALVNQGRW
jgi:ankyrin repeat protein